MACLVGAGASHGQASGVSARRRSVIRLSAYWGPLAKETYSLATESRDTDVCAERARSGAHSPDTVTGRALAEDSSENVQYPSVVAASIFTAFASIGRGLSLM